MNKLKQMANKAMKSRTAKKIGAGVSVALASGATFAADWTDEINTANAEAVSNSTLVISACIGLAILGFGVGHMMGWFGKK